jgi:hypothetical protein
LSPELIDSQSLPLLLSAALTFSIGVIGGHWMARLRLSEVEFCKLQLKNVRRGLFGKQKLMNFSEFRVFRAIEQDAGIKRAGFRIVAQAPLGEILQSKNRRAYAAINSKRVDMLIIDRGGWPLLAVEYQGEGHWDPTSKLRDAMKSLALRKAGVRYLEVFPKDKSEKIISLVYENLGLTPTMPHTA